MTQGTTDTNTLAQRLWVRLESGLNRLCTEQYNPMYYLGAIGIYFIWVVLVSGVYLFAFYGISPETAYSSIEYLTEDQWYLGGVMRSLHRYCSDGLVIIMIVHALRMFVKNRYKFWRRIAWVSGIFMAWIIWISGIFGYWMVWDEKGKLNAIFSAELLDVLPIFSLPLSLNFAHNDNVTALLFYIVLFIHFTSILFLFILYMVHLSRVTKAVITPPRPMLYGVSVVLLLLAFIKPATSSPPADLATLTQSVDFDWFFMFLIPLRQYFSENVTWFFIVSLTLMVGYVPWISRRGVQRSPAAEVNPENCTGCELCMEDCPYTAIFLRPRADADTMGYDLEAVVSSERCASCGICVGACDYNAINLPHMPETDVKDDIRALSAELADNAGLEAPTVMVFACSKGVDTLGMMTNTNDTLDGMEWTRVVRLPCIGMLQPSMLTIPFDAGVGGVFISSCPMHDCHFRVGSEWHRGRLAGNHPPVVRRKVDRGKVKLAFLTLADNERFIEELTGFRSSLEAKPKGGDA